MQITERTASMSVVIKTDSPRTYVLTIDVEIAVRPKSEHLYEVWPGEEPRMRTICLEANHSDRLA
jgi:hypothetical protein